MNVVSCRKDVALSQDHLVAAGMRRGMESRSSGHVASSHCLQTPTIKQFPDRSGSAISLSSRKTELQGIREMICRSCMIPLPRKPETLSKACCHVGKVPRLEERIGYSWSFSIKLILTQTGQLSWTLSVRWHLWTPGLRRSSECLWAHFSDYRTIGLVPNFRRSKLSSSEILNTDSRNSPQKF